MGHLILLSILIVLALGIRVAALLYRQDDRAFFWFYICATVTVITFLVRHYILLNLPEIAFISRYFMPGGGFLMLAGTYFYTVSILSLIGSELPRPQRIGFGSALVTLGILRATALLMGPAASTYHQTIYTLQFIVMWVCFIGSIMRGFWNLSSLKPGHQRRFFILQSAVIVVSSPALLFDLKLGETIIQTGHDPNWLFGFSTLPFIYLIYSIIAWTFLAKQARTHTTTNHTLLAKLSTRENEIATLILQGKSYPDIADTLFISLTTVKTHAKNIFQKTECHNRKEFAGKLLHS